MAKENIEEPSQIKSEEIIINNPFELFNDALLFFEEINNIEDKLDNRFKRWRYIRLTIVCSLMSLESYINNFLIKEGNNGINVKKTALEDKLTNGMEKTAGKSINKESKTYEDFLFCKKIRNNLVHFDGDINIYKEQLSPTNAGKSINMVREIIKEVHKINNSKAPEWVFMKEHQNI